jgi:hypothetical protein
MMKKIILFLFALTSILACSKPVDTTPGKTNCDDVDFSMTSNKWKMYSIYQEYKTLSGGVYEETAEGLKAYSLTNRGGSMILTNKEFDLTGKTVYMKWKTNGLGAFSALAPFISNNCYDDPFVSRKELAFFSTNNTYNQFLKVTDGTWYFTKIQFSVNSATSVTASGNYSDQGGTVIQDIAITNVNPIGRFGVYNGDTYTTGANFVFGECKIR